MSFATEDVRFALQRQARRETEDSDAVGSRRSVAGMRKARREPIRQYARWIDGRTVQAVQTFACGVTANHVRRVDNCCCGGSAYRMTD